MAQYAVYKRNDFRKYPILKNNTSRKIINSNLRLNKNNKKKIKIL